MPIQMTPKCYICEMKLDRVNHYDPIKNSWTVKLGCPRCKIVWSGELLLDMTSIVQLIRLENKDKHTRINYYECADCNVKWEMAWDCDCEDDCPTCKKAHLPYVSREKKNES